MRRSAKTGSSEFQRFLKNVKRESLFVKRRMLFYTLQLRFTINV